jgi:predicted phosphoribosyltransferase
MALSTVFGELLFKDRLDAADQLAKALDQYRGTKPLILAIPRGAVPMGKRIAELLGGELDVVLVRKIPAPFQPELAVGSVDESGHIYVSPHAEMAGADEAHIKSESAAQLQLIAKRRAQYSANRKRIDPAGRTVIVVDDGLATGATMMAALHSASAAEPARLICAVPVASRESLRLIEPYADEVVCLHAPDDFQAVGNYYRYFPQVEDEEVVAALG